MSKLFQATNGIYTCSYVDDLVVYSDTFEQHLEHLANVLEIFKNANLKVSLTKSNFCKKELKYLGFIINSEGVKIDPSKTAAIESYPRPQTVKQCRRFIGMTSYYRRFIPNFSELSAPITDLTKKNAKFNWTDTHETAFLKLRQQLAETPILIFPDFNQPFSLQVDASTKAVAGNTYTIAR
ncbi:unnamed protein product [Rotaria socialis]|uniref:Reverse transcriptase domain-containing protein n=1 Tax=Rotaria socialis TaxID=392032 RepID=A0A818SZG9_9BILA|nr:unnamed protein product [Rotaria socialis]CAF4761739.1 unnamed protein product [Rotaria socialis]